MTKIPRTLKEELRQRRVVPLVGAGVSMAVKRRDGTPLFPSWRELLLRGADRLEDEGKSAAMVRELVEEDGDYLAAAKRLRDKLGASWSRFLKEQLVVPRSEVDDNSLALASAVWRLGGRLILTTNYDHVLRWACPEAEDLAEWDIEAVDELAHLLRDTMTRRPTVWHLHGRIDNTANLVLTPDGYRQLYANDGTEPRYRAAFETLRYQFAARSILFVGFSFADGFFGAELESVFEVFKGSVGPHYAVVHKRDVNPLREKGLPIELLPFDDFGPPLVELVEGLGDMARTSGGEVESVSEARPSEMREPSLPPNPFDDLGRITAPERFFDREETLETIFEELRCGRNVSLVGEVQIGKSSVLSQVCVQGPKQLELPPKDFVYLDMQELSDDEEFFAALSEELGFPRLKGYRLNRALGKRKIVLCLDELEKMNYPGFTREVRAQVRGLADGNKAPLTLVLASRMPLIDLFPDCPGETSPLASICSTLLLGPFLPRIARRFIRHRLATVGRQFSETDEDRLISDSGCHPGRLQLLSYERYHSSRRIEGS